ncbi:uncharacterized protein N7483_008633 [Penicillium malachiteum]|uniref:uncharacterized protein n=1 Tax=Penicillium malachiteum TaxID=1324776 RepID=UPI002547AAFB|nr:uncharacterized protein N7483_008633 [Penicillium malachiteum]KAJ5720699.1 hypothetical protein N7483_008633 [Penicillium malachiteum]
MPTSLRPLTLRAIEAAHLVLEHFTQTQGYREGIVGMPLYLHSMIAFAAVFLVKMSYCWHVIGITIDPAQRTRPLIQAHIKLLRDCRAGANHMVFSMANGFERMLKQIHLPAPAIIQKRIYSFLTHRDIQLKDIWYNKR